MWLLKVYCNVILVAYLWSSELFLKVFVQWISVELGIILKIFNMWNFIHLSLLTQEFSFEFWKKIPWSWRVILYNRLLNFYACPELQIYVVDSLDRDRIGKSKAEFQVSCCIHTCSYVSWAFINQTNIKCLCCRQ